MDIVRFSSWLLLLIYFIINRYTFLIIINIILSIRFEIREIFL